MQMRHFTNQQPLPDILITPQWWKLDPEVSPKHDAMYASVWECEDDKITFDAENDNATPPNSPEIAVKSDLSTEETWNTPGTAHECSRETFPQTEELCNVTDTYPYMEPDAETSSKQPNNRPTNSRSSNYKLRHYLKPNCNDEYRY